MSNLRAFCLVLASVSLLTLPARAQSQSATPGLYGLGLGQTLGNGWGLRGDYSPGFLGGPADSAGREPRWGGRTRSSLYADWFPFASSGFRVVGGLTLNDTSLSPLRAGVAGAASPAPSLSGSASGADGWFTRTRNPTTSTYFGIGFSQLGMSDRGLGLYADMGVTLGTSGLDADPASAGQSALSAEGWRMQGNGWFGFTYLPSVSLGLIYRY